MKWAATNSDLRRPAGRDADCRIDTDETVQGVDLGGKAAVTGGRRCRRLKMVGTMPREPITNVYRGLFDVALMDQPVAKDARRWEVHAIRINIERLLRVFF